VAPGSRQIYRGRGESRTSEERPACRPARPLVSHSRIERAPRVKVTPLSERDVGLNRHYDEQRGEKMRLGRRRRPRCARRPRRHAHPRPPNVPPSSPLQDPPPTQSTRAQAPSHHRGGRGDGPRRDRLRLTPRDPSVPPGSPRPHQGGGRTPHRLALPLPPLRAHQSLLLGLPRYRPMRRSVHYGCGVGHSGDGRVARWGRRRRAAHRDEESHQRHLLRGGRHLWRHRGDHPGDEAGAGENPRGRDLAGQDDAGGSADRGGRRRPPPRTPASSPALLPLPSPSPRTHSLSLPLSLYLSISLSISLSLPLLRLDTPSFGPACSSASPISPAASASASWAAALPWPTPRTPPSLSRSSSWRFSGPPLGCSGSSWGSF